MFTSKKQKIITYTVFGVYLFLLIWLILFKFSTNPFELDRFRNINLIPFRQSLAVNGKLAVDEIIYNMLVFVPFGVYTAFLLPKQNFLKKRPSLFY